MLTDLELFLKYNMKSNKRQEKNENLNYQLFSNQIHAKKRSRKNFVVIILEYSYNCNLNCIYCENSLLRNYYGNAIISEENIRNIVKKFGENIDFIQLCGGETLLIPESLILALVDERQKNNLHFDIGLQTNGTLLSKENKQFLEDLEIVTGFSFDGIFNLENRGQLSTDQMLNILSTNKHIGLNNTFTQQNIFDTNNSNPLIANYNFYKQLGLFSFNSTLARQIIEDNDNVNNSPININKNFIDIMTEYIDYWIHDVDHPIHEITIEKQIMRLFGESQRCFDMNCTEGFIRIDPYGNIGPCGCNLALNHYCNINDINSYNDLLNNQNYKETVAKMQKLIFTNCNRCIWQASCVGGCMGMNYQVDHNYNKINKKFCNYTKFILANIYKMIKNIDLEKDKDKYNPLLLELLRENNYYSFDEILAIEAKYNNEQD